MNRRFIDAPTEQRCAWTVTLRDGSWAQCGRHKTVGDLCTQHAKMAASFSCEYCGGNDELPPDHCMDCSRPRPPNPRGEFVQCVACRDYDENATCPQCPGYARATSDTGSTP